MTIKLKNISGRNFNWINPGEIINIDEKLKATYINAWFKLIETQKETWESENNEKSKAELVKEAKALGLEFPWNISKAKLQDLINEAQKETWESENNKD